MTDQERESHIRSCGDLMRQAFEAGNHKEARQWMALMYEAIGLRSEAQQQRMTGQIDRAIAESGVCHA